MEINIEIMNTLSNFANTIFKRTYQFNDDETWEECAARVAKFVCGDDYDAYYKAIHERKFMPGGRYLYSAGRDIPQTTNCYLTRAGDSREEWGELVNLAINALTTGGGVGTEYSLIREKGAPIKRYGGTASGPISLMAMLNEVARHVMAGGKRRSALWAGLNWSHPDVHEFIEAKNWNIDVKAIKSRDFNFPAVLDMTNISVGLDDEFFKAVKHNKKVQEFYYNICKGMCKTGEPGFSINIGDEKNNVLRNPCTEVVSDTHGDCCNLGSVNLARIGSVGELEEVTRLATRFLYRGTFVGWMPYALFKEVREKNRRIGLGILGLHEWCVRNGQEYGPSAKLARWLSIWQQVSDDEASKIAKEMNSVRPVAVRAIAPTGTIGIIAETTTGIEPVYCAAFKRRFLGEGQKWKHQFVCDPTVARLVQEGHNANEIEDAYTLSIDVERRIAMQAFVQEFVDQAISSTINLPEWGEVGNNNAKEFGRILLKYLPKLRGITVYPDGSRPGQPITPVAYDEAVKHKDIVYEESDSRCVGGVCGV